MRVGKIIKKTFAEGPGCRFCVWVQGCSHRCDGCFATNFQDFNGGYQVAASEIIAQINDVKDDICGITFLGGEPFAYSDELAVIAKYIHSLNKNVITFTGYEYETLKANDKSLLSESDLLIDGRFEKALEDYTRPLAGSSNQRFIFLTDRISKSDIKDYKNRFEIRITPDGKAEFNGMGNISKLNAYISGRTK